MRDRPEAARSRLVGLALVVVPVVCCMPLAAGAQTQADPYPVDPELIEIGRRYLETVYRFDYEGQATFYMEESVFEDRTVDIFDLTWRIEGGDRIVDLFRNTKPETPLEVEVDIRDAFIVGDRVHFWVHYVNTGDGTPLGRPGETISVVARGITILRIVDGKHLYEFEYTLP
mgnify:CR=1 FL=1